MSQVIPTKGNLIHLKSKETLAQSGEVLLDRKKNILIQEVLTLVADITNVRTKLQETYKKLIKHYKMQTLLWVLLVKLLKQYPLTKTYRSPIVH